jgi:hypothetical protein
MSRWLDRANGFAACARDTLAAAKAWPLWRPIGITKKRLKESCTLRMHIMSNAICSASSHHKQSTTDQKVNSGVTPHPIFRFQEMEKCTVPTI